MFACFNISNVEVEGSRKPFKITKKSKTKISKLTPIFKRVRKVRQKNTESCIMDNLLTIPLLHEIFQ